MAKTIGKITFENGSFFIKHPDGTLEVAKVGAMLSEGDVIIGSSSNSNSNLIRVSLIDNSSEIQVVGSNEQLFDITLLSGEIPEDTVVPNSQVGDLLEQATNNQQDPNQNNEQATLTLAQIENLDAAAAGADQTTTEPVGIVPLRLEDRTAGETNITTDLRDAEVVTTVIDETVLTNSIDDVPTTGANPLVSLDDDTLGIDSIGNPLAVNFGLNGAGSVALTSITADASLGLTSSVAGNVMTISQNGVAVMTITLNDVGGTYTYDVNQIAAISHPDATTEDNIDFTVNYVVTDVDGDTATGTFGIVVNDSVPAVDISLATAGAVVTDETNQLGTTVTGTDSILTYTTAASLGADSAGGTIDVSLKIDTAATGFTTTDGDHAISLVADASNNNIVYGKYDSDGDGTLDSTAFTVSISEAGILSVKQDVAMNHPTTTDNDEAITLANKLSAVVTVTDGDNDVATDSVSIGASISFKDDGPAVDISLATAGAVVTDETNQLGTTVTGTDSILTYTTAATGFTTTDGDHAISLVADASNNNIVYGKYDSDGDGTLDSTAFTVSISKAGILSVKQDVAMNHPTTTDNDEAITLANKLSAVVTVTDGDNDVATDSVSIGASISFKDDGPAVDISLATAGAVVTDETNQLGTTVTGTDSILTYTTAASLGADSAGGTIDVSLKIDTAATGFTTTDGDHAISLVADASNNNIVYGKYDSDGDGTLDSTAFTVSISEAGILSVKQDVAMNHPTTTDNDEAITLANKLSAVVTVTDGDNDVATDSVSIGASISFKDDGPAVDISLATAGAVVTDETNQLGTTVTGTDSILTYTTAASLGADSAGGTIDVSLKIDTAATGFTTTDGDHAISLVADASNNNIVYGKYDSDGDGTLDSTAFTVSISEAGILSVKQDVAMNHPTTTDNDEAITLANKLSAVVTVTDGDNDVATDSVSIGASISFKDDGPAVISPDEISILDAATSPNITRALNFEAGADGLGDVTFDITNGQIATDSKNNAPLTFDGKTLYLYYGADETVIYASTVSPSSTTLTPDINSTTTTGFWIDIDPTNGTYTMHSNGIIGNGTALTATEADAIGAGNTSFRVLQDLGTTSEDVIITGTGTINTSQTIGVGGGQSFSVGDGIRFDFVNGATVSGNGANQTFSYNGTHNNTTAFKQQIAWGTIANLTVSAIVADSDSVFYGDNSGESFINLSTSNIKIYNAQNILVTNLASSGVTLVDNGNSITINGLPVGWYYQIVTDSSNQFNAVQLVAAASTSEFKLGYFTYGVDYSGDPVELQYNIIATDGDGDSINGTIDATLYPDHGATWVGNDTDDTFVLADNATQVNLLGGEGDDTLTGNSSDNVIVGDLGNDTLYGGAGNDYLDGGAGADTISGGAGNDTIVYDGQDVSIDGGSGIDTLVLSGSDSIDFSNVNTPNISSIENIDLTASGTQSIAKLTLADVVQLTQDQVDSNGNHILKITGSDTSSTNEDSVNLLNTIDSVTGKGAWTSSGIETIDNVSYNVYTNDTDPTYKVAIANVDDVNISNS